MKSIFRYLLLTTSLILFFSCGEKNNGDPTPQPPVNETKDNDKSIVIVYENDVHCSVDGYITFAGYRDAVMSADTSYVATVSSGDFLQGGAVGAFSKGEYIIDIMNVIGYDAVTIGNHELDYKVPRLQEMTKKLSSPVTCVNFTDVSNNRLFSPYVVKQMGKKKVAFVGVITPSSINSESYAFYDDDRNQLYDVHDDDLNSLVQASVDDARKQGADYVILLSHLGIAKESCNSNVYTVIAGTNGIDAVLDGHSHSLVKQQIYSNKDGKNVVLTQTGSKFSNVGVLTITKDGKISSDCIKIEDISYKSEKVKNAVDKINEQCSVIFDKKIAYSDFPLSITNEDGKRIVRNDECNLGDLIADGIRAATGAQVGLINGGGISKGIPAGDITWRNVYDCQTFGNSIVIIEATGQQLIDHLEACANNYPNESGSFMQVSGIKFRLNPAARPTLYVNKKTYALIVDGPRRITGVRVQNQEGKWETVESEKVYTIGTINFISDTDNSFPCLIPCKKTADNMMSDVDCLGSYIESFGGTVPQIYSSSQKRINIY